MPRRSLSRTPFLLAAALVLAGCAPTGAPGGGGAVSTRYEDLTNLFEEWRAFQKPKVTDLVPDYTLKAMATQKADLATYQRRLAAIDPKGWPVAQQVDYHIVRAEMNGLDFDHRVLRPWARNPAFYVSVFPSQSDQPAREGHFAWGAIEIWQYQFPLTAEAAADLGAKLKMIPKLLEQAKGNLVDNAKDIWVFGTESVKEQSTNLENLAARVGRGNAALLADIQTARDATDKFHTWLKQQAPSKTGPSGIGVENYDWYLKNVHLLPYTWAEEVTLMRRELARAHAALRLEEQHNRRLPEQMPITNGEEHARRFNAGVTEYINFLRDRDILTIKNYMEPALRARVGRFSDRPREFFTEVDYRDPVIMRTHGYHWFDLARMANEPHGSPIRRGPLLYNIFDSRTEGLATGWEETMMHAGLVDTRPRSRELIYILLAQRAARALGDLMMHGKGYSIEEAAKFASEWTPRGWLRLDGRTVRHEQHLYLQQPAYGTSYVIGKIEIDRLMAERARQMGDQFTLRRFMAEFDAAGLIPISLVRWELTGLDDDITRMTAP